MNIQGRVLMLYFLVIEYLSWNRNNSNMTSSTAEEWNQWEQLVSNILPICEALES